MKLLFDQNLSPQLVDDFKGDFDEIVHIKDLGLDRAEDSKVWEYAKSNNYTIVSKDSDFNNMVSLFGFPPKVIWIRKGNCTTKEIRRLVTKNLDEIKKFIEDSENGILTIL
jgi:predicted nuclease of predicted toxin-antitoxin system